MVNALHSDVAVVVWPWLFPATYLAHIAEEYWGGGGFSLHQFKKQGIVFTTQRFLALTGVGFVLIVVGIILGEAFGFLEVILVILGTVVLANGLSHTVSWIVEAEYNPGLITGLLIWIPLGAATLYARGGGMRWRSYLIAVGVGIGVQAVVTALASRGEKKLKENEE
jgi:hypothetical protein